jgi:hypothetical protein
VTVPLLTALLLQVVAISLLRHRLGRYWLRHPTTLIVLASAVYQGLSPIMLIFQSIGTWDIYRNGVQQSFINTATLLMSAGMLVFTITYLMTRPERGNVIAGSTGIPAVVKALDWRWLTAACAPLAVLTYAGRGYNNAVPSAGSATSLGSDLAATFFIALVVVAAFSFLLKQGVRWFIPVLIAQSLVLAAAGERTPVITDAITLILMLLFAGCRPSTRQLRAASVLTLITILAITGLRAERGRSLFYENSGFSTRLFALASGITAFTNNSGSSSTGPSLVAQAVVRVDGVDFAGAILQSLSSGQPRLGAAYVPESLLIAVPSSVWSSKLAHSNVLNPAQREIKDFDLQQVNFLPTLPGLYVGYLSVPWLVAFLAFIGLLCGLGERWLFRRCTPVRFVLLAGAITAALSYEGGLPGMLLALRAAAAIAVAVKVIEALRVRNSQTRGRKTRDARGDFDFEWKQLSSTARPIFPPSSGRCLSLAPQPRPYSSECTSYMPV